MRHCRDLARLPSTYIVHHEEAEWDDNQPDPVASWLPFVNRIQVDILARETPQPSPTSPPWKPAHTDVK